MGDGYAHTHTRRSGRKHGRRKRQRSSDGRVRAASRNTAKTARDIRTSRTFRTSKTSGENGNARTSSESRGASATGEPARVSSDAASSPLLPPDGIVIARQENPEDKPSAGRDGAGGSNGRRRRQSEFTRLRRELKHPPEVATQSAGDGGSDSSDQRDLDAEAFVVTLAEPEVEEAPNEPGEPVATPTHRARRMPRSDYGDHDDYSIYDNYDDRSDQNGQSVSENDAPGIWDTGWSRGVRDDVSWKAASQRLRAVVRQRPAAIAVLALFLLGFLLTCAAPLVPLLRLGYDAMDATRRLATLNHLATGGPAQLMNAEKLQEARIQVTGIQRDLYEINGAINVIGAPVEAISPGAQNYRLLVQIGLDLTMAADGGIQAAQTLLKPLESGSILSADPAKPGITAADIQQAQASLAIVRTHLLEANAAYQRLDQSALPDQFKPGTTAGKLLVMIPAALNAVNELKTLLEIAPALLGVGQPAYYLVVAMDSTELRPGGGFIGNYGILTLENGKQSGSAPLSLSDTYPLDQKYYQKALEPYRIAQHVKSVTDVKGCESLGPQPPATYWWWPFRDFDATCKYGWGLRDANLSPSFPENARAMIQIVEDAGGEIPDGAQLQGAIAFTPELIKELLTITGPITVPQFNVMVTGENLEDMIHMYQLTDARPKGSDRKTFTHLLSTAMLDKLKTLHGSTLADVLKIGQEALTRKDLQLYFADPRAELVLRQFGFSSEARAGGGDGFMVVDANDGGNKANAYVTERQTDLVTLLPDGAAIHRLQIVVTYDKGRHSVYPGTTQQDDYSDFQRTYLPGDAVILGIAGFNPNSFDPSTCRGSGVRGYGSIITDCSPKHAIINPVTTSDTPGRAMVGGALLVLCGQYGAFTSTKREYESCETEPKAHSQTIYISWLTPDAFTPQADGHGAYTEVVEHQAGNPQTLKVYVDTSQLRGAPPPAGKDSGYTVQGNTPAARDAAFARLFIGATKVYDGPLTQDQVVTFNF